MAKEKEEMNKPVETNAPTASTTPYEDAWFAGMEEAYPNLKGDREALYKASKEGYDSQHAYVKKSQEEGERLNSILASNPDLNEMFNEIFERGESGHPELALLHMKPLLKQYVNGELSTDEYLAEKQRLQEEDAAFQRKQEMREAAFVAECEERGWDVEETLTKVDAVLNNPCETEEQCRDQVRNIFKIIEFDDAVSAAEVRGKNAKIEEQKRKNPAPQMGNNGASAPASAGKQSLMSSAAERARKMKDMF